MANNACIAILFLLLLCISGDTVTAPDDNVTIEDLVSGPTKDINKKEAPRIRSYPKQFVSFNKNSRSDDDLRTASSGYYGESINEERGVRDEDETPKILGIRVTSSVAVARGSPIPRRQVDTFRKITASNYIDESPTTWRPSHKDLYKGMPSNRHTVTTLPGSLIGGGEKSILTKERDPYHMGISYGSRPRHKPPLTPSSFSFTSVNSVDPWRSSTGAEFAPTEATPSFVTIVGHQPSSDNFKPLTQLDGYTGKSKSDIDEGTYMEPAKIYSEPAKVYGEPSKIYGQPSKIYSEPAKIYGEPAKVYGEPAKVYSEPAKVYSEPAKVYSEPAMVYHSRSIPGLNDDPHELTRARNDETYAAGVKQLDKKVDESVSVMTNGKSQEDNGKVGYVVEGREYRKYRVEERTSDGFIVGEYGVVSNNDGTLRGVRYTADGTTNPRLIYDALMKFLSL